LNEKLKFSDLHPERAFPWHELVCVLPHLSREGWEKRMRFESRSPLLIEAPRELIIGDQWKPLNTLSRVELPEQPSEATSEKDTKSNTQEIPELQKSKVFLPKYKITVNYQG
jgi:hypothetical protein